jgi:hypothetical protein
VPADLVPLLLGVLLGWAGLAKLTDRTEPEPGSALLRLLPDSPLVALALRTLGAVEVGLAAVLLVRPLWTAGGWAAAALGAAFVGYLGWARAVAPDSRPVTVVFALAADAAPESPAPAVRVTVVDADRQEVLPAPRLR